MYTDKGFVGHCVTKWNSAAVTQSVRGRQREEWVANRAAWSEDSVLHHVLLNHS